MAIWDDLFGGGTFLLADFVSGHQERTSFGAANDIIITPPAGQRVLLTGLKAFARLTLVNIDVGTRNVVIDKTLEAIEAQVGAVDEFVIITGGTQVGDVPPILGDVDEVIRIFRADATATAVLYGYVFMK